MSAHILVIDDEKSWLQNLVFVLRHKHYNVTAVETGREGLQLIRDNPNKYDIVLLDLMLADMSGLEVLAVLKEERCAISVVLQTGSQDVPPIMKALEKGALCCLRKPYNHHMLYPVLEEILGGGVPQEKVLSLSALHY